MVFPYRSSLVIIKLSANAQINNLRRRSLGSASIMLALPRCVMKLFRDATQPRERTKPNYRSLHTRRSRALERNRARDRSADSSQRFRRPCGALAFAADAQRGAARVLDQHAIRALSHSGE